MQQHLPTRAVAGDGGETTIEGTLERVTYANEETGWSVVRMQVPGRGAVTAVGSLLGVQPGESLRLTGRWQLDRKYGEQFRASSFLTVEPATVVGIERYLGSGLVHGIGAAMARRLVRHFGLETLDVIDRAPERLREVEGIGPVRSGRIRDAWREQQAIRQVMIFLQGHGVSSAFAAKIFKVYGHRALRVVRESPYRLAEEVWGIGFRTADRIARDLGIARDAPQRAAAGVLYALRRASDDGHLYRTLGELLDDAGALLDIGPESIRPAIAALRESGQLTIHDQAAPGDQPAIFLTPLDRAEQGLATRLRRLASRLSPPLALDAEGALAWYQQAERMTLAPHQRQALARAFTAKLLVITGGPGTGKTTLVRGLVRILSRKGLRIELAAPTGRAAKRLAEATGAPARTVHRLLEWSPRARAFGRDSDHPLDADLVVIDEASMLDTLLAYHIVKAVPDAGRLILVGDVDQLPSVGPGRVLADVIAAGVVEVVRLTEIFRQAQRSLIVTNAHQVRAGALPTLRPDNDDGDFFFFAREEPEAVLATLRNLVSRRIPRRFGFDPRHDIQVLTPMQRGLLGAGNLNAELQATINPRGRAVARGSRLLRIGDRVMQQRNNYDLDVWNGDVGTVAAIDDEAQTLTVTIDGREVGFGFTDLDELTLAYACSIHKSQGSEYPCVVIPLHTQHYVMLERNLLYTAITRGRRLVVVVGSPRALALAVRTQHAHRRATLLERRLRA